MRISFIIPFINWTGGIRIVFEYAERLHQRGHEVSIYFPLFPYRFSDRLYTLRGLRRWVGDLVLNLRRRTRQKWFRLSVPLIMVPWISDHFVSDGDAVIATAWPTAYSVYRLSRSKGTKFYFVQQYESWSGPQDAVDSSYRLPLHKIAAASWLSRLITERFGEPVLDTIIQGVNFALFYPDGRSPDRTGRVLMQYSPLEWKGLADGFRAWEIVQQRCPWARLVMFGMKRGPDVPPNVQFYEDPLRMSYGEYTVHVIFSYLPVGLKDVSFHLWKQWLANALSWQQMWAGCQITRSQDKPHWWLSPVTSTRWLRRSSGYCKMTMSGSGSRRQAISISSNSPGIKQWNGLRLPCSEVSACYDPGFSHHSQL